MADEVLLREPFCPGYVDSIGHWNNGFACPTRGPTPMFCCGTATYRYCCRAVRDVGAVGGAGGGAVEDAGDGARAVSTSNSNVTLILGVVFGVLVSTAVVVAALFFIWRTWRTRRKPRRNGGQLFCVTGGGAASLYTGSLHSSRLGSPQFGEDTRQTVDEVAIRPPFRLATPATVPVPPRLAIAAYGNNRGLLSLSESSDSTSVSSASASDISVDRLYARVGRCPPPAYSFRCPPCPPLRTLSLSPPESVSVTKPPLVGGGGGDGSASDGDNLGISRDERSRSSSLFKSTRF